MSRDRGSRDYRNRDHASRADDPAFGVLPASGAAASGSTLPRAPPSGVFSPCYRGMAKVMTLARPVPACAFAHRIRLHPIRSHPIRSHPIRSYPIRSLTRRTRRGVGPAGGGAS